MDIKTGSYFSMNNIKIYNGDCLEGMDKIPNKFIDMILCDLPYGVTNNKEDKVIPFDRLWLQYERIIKDNGAIVLFAQGKFYIELCMSNLKLFRYNIIWDKQLTTGFLNAKKMPLRKHEEIAVFYKKPPIYNPQFTEGKPSHSKGTKYLENDVMQNNQNYGKIKNIEEKNDKDSSLKYPTSIISFQKPHPSKAFHRTEKPIELLEWLIKTYTEEGQIILDNCMGSGSTSLACINTNRKFIGMEIDKGYFEIAKNRIKEAIDNKKNL